MFWYPKDGDYDKRDSEGVTLREFLKSYDPNRYEHPAVTVDNLIFKKRAEGPELLLIRRGRHPSFGRLALPGGFIEMDETLEEAAARELYEETGLKDIRLTQLGAYGALGRDPRMRIISVAYMAVLDREVHEKAGDDAADAGFYTVSLKCDVINSEKKYHLMFANGKKTAASTVAESAGKRTILGGDIASDHAIMILDALERLGFIENK